MKHLAALTIALLATAFTDAQSRSELPRCVHSDSVIAAIRAAQQANPRTSRKYDGYREALAADTPLQLATRLAYAETLAANCAAQNDRIADLITAAVGNRIRIRGGDVASVVWQRDQFASSLNIYRESRYRDFLCPRDEELWRMVTAKMRANLEAATPVALLPKDAVNYYLYRHSERFSAPDWQLQEVALDDASTRACIRLFRAPYWR